MRKHLTSDGKLRNKEQRIDNASRLPVTKEQGWASLVAQIVKNLPAMQETWVRSLGSIPGSGRSPGEGNGNPFEYSCLEDPMDGGAWWATVHRVAKSQRRLSDFTHSPNLRSFLSLFLQMYFLYRFPSLHLLRFQ